MMMPTTGRIRRRSIQLLLLLAVFRHSQGKQQKEASPAVEVHHPRDLLSEDSIQSRVVGGNTVTNYDKHPFFAEWHGQFCGGALIHDDLVLTAAHCDNAGGIAREIFFRNIKRGETGSVKRTITEHITHPLYNAQFSTRDYDYMLLKLDKSALVDDYGNPTGVQVININTDPTIPAAGDALWGIGFGQLGENIAGMSTELKDATIYAFGNPQCERQYAQYYEQDYMFCSGVDGGGTDTCQGDSGGPIVHKTSNTLVGLVSFGIGCARANYAGVNARVSAVADWIVLMVCQWSEVPKCGGSYAPTSTPAPFGSTPPAPHQTPGSVTLSIQFDDYPEEIAWVLVGADPQTPLQFQPWKTVPPPLPSSSITEQFDGLAPNIHYQFKIADAEGDGICCAYGQGQITLRDNVQGVNLWTNRGNFGSYFEVQFVIKANGQAKVTHKGAHYTPSTWPALEELLAPDNEPFWPGRMPTANTHSVMVNVDTDDYPEEMTWTLHRLTGNNNAWTQVETWSGIGKGFRVLESQEIPGLQRGWHRFVVRDSEGDGNCCEYGTGYVSLTGPLAAQSGGKGLVWGNNGKFWGMDQVFFYVDNAGYISRTTNSAEAATARTIQRPTGILNTP